MAVELATAYISLVADTKGLGKDISRDLRKAGDQAGNQAGNDFASAFTSKAKGAKADLRGSAEGGQQAGAKAGGDFVSGFDSKAKGVKGSVSGALSDGAKGGGDAGGGMGASFLDGFGGKIGALGAAGGPIGMALAGVGTVGLAAGGVLAKAVMDGFGQMQSRDLIQARLGVDEATMGRIGAAASGAFANAWGESTQANLETAQLAIQGGILNGEETAGGMQPIIEKLNAVNDLIGGDMQTTVQATGSLLKNGLAKDAEGAFDIITRSYQRGGAIGDDLVDSIKEYGDGWEQTGFSGEFAMGLIIQSMENGADNTDRAADAVREFGRRMYEEAPKIKEAIGDLGLPVDDLFDKLKEGGPQGEAAFDQIFDAIRKVEDPTKRAALAQQLLGDTAGDFINNFTQWDPSVARKKFGDVAGAAQAAADTISDNPMEQWQSSLNTLSVEADNLKLSLAGAFAPMATDLATWVSEHKPEIIGFFTDLGSATLTTADGVLAWTSAMLRGWEGLGTGIGNTVSEIVNVLSGLARAGATVLDAIPGMGDDADALRTAADGMDGFAGGILKAGENAGAAADIIDNTLRPGLQNARNDLNAAGAQAQNTEILMRSLGQTIITDIPDGKSVVIESNSPQQKAELEALGLKVTTLPNGQFKVTSNTEEGQSALDNFIAKNSGRVVGIKLSVDEIINRYGVGTQDAVRAGFLGGRAIPGRATGGIFRGKGGPTDDANLVRISDREFITRASSVNSGTLPWLEAINSGWVPPADMLHGMVPGFATGGLFDRDAATGKAKAHNGEPYVYGGLDCSGYLSAVFNAGTGAGVRFVTGSDFASMGWAPGYDPNGFSIGTNGGVGENGHMAGTLYGVNVESDGSNGIQYGGSADGALDFPMVWHWPGASAGDDPSTERLTDSGLDTSMLGGGGTGGGSVPGSGGTGGAGGFSGGGSGGGGGTPSSGTVSVFVTNWPTGGFVPNADDVGVPTTDIAPSAAPVAPEADPNRFDPQKRAAEFGAEVGDIGTKAALDILGLGGTIADPSHRYWQAARDTQTAFAKQAEQQGGGQSWRPGVQIDNHVTVSSDQEQLRRFEELNKRLLAQFGGATP